MLVSEFADPVQAVGQGANVVGDDRIPDGVQWRVSLGREFLLPAGPVVLHRCIFEVGEMQRTMSASCRASVECCRRTDRRPGDPLDRRARKALISLIASRRHASAEGRVAPATALL